MPGTRGELKSVQLRDSGALLLLPADLTGIDAACQPLGLSACPFASCGERDGGVRAQPQFSRLAVLLETVEPRLASLADAQVQTLAVRKQILLVARLCSLDLQVVEQPHVVPPKTKTLKNSLGYSPGYTQRWDDLGFNDTA